MAAKPLTKIIVVDDDQDILKIVEFSLESMSGVTIKYCTSGQDGIAEALSFHPDLMILDVMMPNMNGIEMVKAIKLLPDLKDTPIIFLTAKMQAEEIAECHKVGVKDIIPKPFDPIALPDTIKQMWDKMNG